MIVHLLERQAAKELNVLEGLTVQGLLEMLGYTKHAAVWVNDEQVLYGEYSVRELKDNDCIHIIKPLGGG